jgi:uncharacterized Fe-S cluster-containing radical SAM superfamily protein
MPSIKTDDLSRRLREQAVRPAKQQVLIARISGSAQELDLSEAPNCEGYGRIRHFRYETPEPWPKNPLPMLPAAHQLGVPVEDVTNAQVFQNAACNWRCWYCYVPFNLLAANDHLANWLTCDELVRLYLQEDTRSLVIDCSGGQPDLTPEWVPWMMEALRKAGLSDNVYLWSDDNLSNDYYWRYLTRDQHELVATYANYGRVCCFKGFDPTSFAFNTRADPKLFDRQFDLFSRLLSTGMDLYAYATFTSPTDRSLDALMRAFVGRLMSIHRNLPLRLVPLRIETYGVAKERVGIEQQTALLVQEDAICSWNRQIAQRFTHDERRVSMPRVSLQG